MPTATLTAKAIAYVRLFLRKSGLRSLEQMIVKPDAKLIDYETRRTKGDNLPDMELLNEQRRKEELVLHIVRYVVKN